MDNNKTRLMLLSYLVGLLGLAVMFIGDVFFGMTTVVKVGGTITFFALLVGSMLLLCGSLFFD